MLPLHLTYTHSDSLSLGVLAERLRPLCPIKPTDKLCCAVKGRFTAARLYWLAVLVLLAGSAETALHLKRLLFSHGSSLSLAIVSPLPI